MPDLLISRVTPGVALVSSVDPFDILEIHRIDREHWHQTPERPGVYLLYGVTPDGNLSVYIGMSTTNMRDRIRRHHVDARRNWFGVLFAVPITNPLLCPAVEADLIGAINEANVVDVIANAAEERRHRNVDDVHVEPAVEKIREGLQLLLGSDIFIARETDEAEAMDPPIQRMTPLAREYRGRAAMPGPRTEDDPEDATHAYVGAGVVGWGQFEGDEPDKRFRVLAGSTWRRATLNPQDATYNSQVRLSARQDELVAEGILDDKTMTFATDHVFENWTLATRTVSGKSSYSGGYHWRPLTDLQQDQAT
jgi:hypothetical protein